MYYLYHALLPPICSTFQQKREKIVVAAVSLMVFNSHPLAADNALLVQGWQYEWLSMQGIGWLHYDNNSEEGHSAFRRPESFTVEKAASVAGTHCSNLVYL